MLRIKKSKNRVWVTFIVEEGNEVYIKGSWNHWRKEPLKRRKNGTFSITKILKPGRYEFGYEIDGEWKTEHSLPSVATPFHSKNSLLEV